MKIQSQLILATTVAHHSSQSHLARSLEIGEILGFHENNYYGRSPKTTANGFNTKYKAPQASPFSNIAQGANSKGKGGGGGTYKQAKGDQNEDDDNKCCTCTCFDHLDKYGRYDKIYQDGNDYCHCTCSCGSGDTMPIIPTIEPLPSSPPPTTEPTLPPPNNEVCVLPSPPIPSYENFINITECIFVDELGQTITESNALVQLQDNIECSGESDEPDTFFLRIFGDNNTIDCNGYSVANRGSIFRAFVFSGRNVILQNCPSIEGFEGVAISAGDGSRLFVSNVTASNNNIGLSIEDSEGYVTDSDFSNNVFQGIFVGGFGPVYSLVLTNSRVANNADAGFRLDGIGEACVENTDISQNGRNVVSDDDDRGSPGNITLANVNACDATIADFVFDTNTSGNNTVLDNVQCEILCRDSRCSSPVNATEIGCIPCVP